MPSSGFGFARPDVPGDFGTFGAGLEFFEEYKRRRAGQSPFLADVLASEHEVLLGALE